MAPSTNLDFEGIAHILRDKPLAVPPYQRAYSWDLEQVKTFWEDLRASVTAQAESYFLGTAVITRQDEHWVVIDGQQRLATTSLLLAAIRDAFLERGDTERASVIERDYLASRSLKSAELRPRLTLNPADAEFFEALLFGQAKPSPEHESHKRISEAYDFLRAAVLEDLDAAKSHWEDRLFAWSDFLETRALLIVLAVPGESDAYLIFETLNDRGVELAIADLIKNYLFGLSRDDTTDVQRAWLTALSSFDVNTEEQTFTNFIRHYWSSVAGPTRERELYRALRREVRSADGAVELARSLARSSPNYAALLDASHHRWRETPGIDLSLVANLLGLSLEQNRPLLLAVLDEVDDHNEIGRILRTVLNAGVRGLIVGGIGGGTTERQYADAARSVRSGRSRTAETVFDDLAEIIPGDSVFESSFSEKRVLKGSLARYYLLAVEAALGGAPEPAVVAPATQDEWTILPIVPRRAEPDEWPEFPDDSLGQWSNRLGNQIPLHGTSVPAEIVLPELASLGGEIARRAGEYSTWNPQAVAQLQQEMAAAALIVWPRS